MKIIHLKLNEPIDGKSDLYFGSLKAIYQKLSPDQVGIKYKSLTNALRGKDHYQNKKCSITIGQVETAKKRVNLQI